MFNIKFNIKFKYIQNLEFGYLTKSLSKLTAATYLEGFASKCQWLQIYGIEQINVKFHEVLFTST